MNSDEAVINGVLYDHIYWKKEYGMWRLYGRCSKGYFEPLTPKITRKAYNQIKSLPFEEAVVVAEKEHELRSKKILD